jgi:hypothetical protein
MCPLRCFNSRNIQKEDEEREESQRQHPKSPPYENRVGRGILICCSTYEGLFSLAPSSLVVVRLKIGPSKISSG